MSSNISFSTETSERYSRALFEVVKESGEPDKIEADIKVFQLLLKSSKDLKILFITTKVLKIKTNNQFVI